MIDKLLPIAICLQLRDIETKQTGLFFEIERLKNCVKDLQDTVQFLLTANQKKDNLIKRLEEKKINSIEINHD